MYKVPFIDLKREYETLRADIDTAYARVLARGHFILGPEVEQFEAAFAAYLGVPHVVTVNSGSDALYLSLRALDIGPGDEVIAPSFTFVSTVDAIVRSGATPVLVDIAPDSYVLDVSDVARKITYRTKAIIPVHLYGEPCDMDALAACVGTKIALVEDACQAHGARYRGRMVGSFGKLGCVSFYPTKNLGAYGDAGAIVTSDDELAQILKQLRNYGSRTKYHHDFIGVNSRLDELQAAILSAKLPHLDEWNNIRRARARAYTDALRGIGDIVLPEERGDTTSAYYTYVIRTKRREELRSFLADAGVQTLIHYPIPVHQQKAYADIARNVSLPVTEAYAREVLSLPLHPFLTQDEQIYVVNTIQRFFAHK